MGMNEKLHSLTTLLAELNEIGGRHGVDQIDISEKLFHGNEVKGGI
jgi:argininosuccinate synthase